jgi:hypothetical protein
MTDRAQPGAIDSIVRNDEIAQIFEQVIEGYLVPGSDPTPAARQRADIDETVLDTFSLSTSSTSLNVTVAPGEAFIGGWCCRDVATTITLPANTTSEIAIGWKTDAVFDPTVDADRDDADETVVDLESNVKNVFPRFTAYSIKTDSNGVTASEQLASIGRPESGSGIGEALAFDYLDVIGT